MTATNENFADEEISMEDLGNSTVHNPEAQALIGGHSKRTNPLLNRGRVRTSLRRGGGGGGGGPWEPPKGKGKGKKGGISQIFQTSITALAFLAFGGYLLCLICTALRNGHMMPMMMNNLQSPMMMPPSRFVVVGGRRPVVGKRRKRGSGEEVEVMRSQGVDLVRRKKKRTRTKRTLTEEDQSKSEYINPFEYMLMKNDTKEQVNFLGDESSADESETEESSTQETTAQIPKWTDKDDTKTLVEKDDLLSVKNQNFTDEDVEHGHWPSANVDDMFQALIMISEGYSLYHDALHAT